MQALIDPTTTNIPYISSWTAPVAPSTLYTPVYSTYPNSVRICQVEPDNQVFPVAEPLYWISCPDNCTADNWYYNTATTSFNEIINAPYPG